jgi:hyperosmotically inducible protein
MSTALNQLMRTLLTHLLVAVPLIAVGACKNKPDKADNTGRNKIVETTADQAAQSGTALDQQAKIRKAIMDDGSLSTNAHNCKVVVDKDAKTVTLTGPVSTSDEKARLERIAIDASGLTVVNNLEVNN